MHRSLYTMVILILLAACTTSTQGGGITNPWLTPLLWSANGKTILVEHRWLYRVDTHAFHDVRPDQVRQQARQNWKVLRDPDDRKRLWFDREHTLIISDSESGVSVMINIPVWFDVTGGHEEAVVNTPFIINSKMIGVQQFRHNAEHEPICAIYDIDKQNWTKTSSACVEAEFFRVASIEHLSGQSYLIQSAAEGAEGLTIADVSLKDNKSIGFNSRADLIVGTASPQQVSVTHGNKAYFVSSCKIEFDSLPYCEGRHDPQTDRWRIYQWDFAAKTLTDSGKTLPIGAVLSGGAQRYAWIKDSAQKELCIKSLNGAGKAECMPLPKE